MRCDGSSARLFTAPSSQTHRVAQPATPRKCRDDSTAARYELLLVGALSQMQLRSCSWKRGAVVIEGRADHDLFVLTLPTFLRTYTCARHRQSSRMSRMVTAVSRVSLVLGERKGGRQIGVGRLGPPAETLRPPSPTAGRAVREAV